VITTARIGSCPWRSILMTQNMISYLKREIDELRVNGAEMLRRLGNIAPKANRTYNFRWDRTSSIARRDTR
jgi:hypothetical protein